MSFWYPSQKFYISRLNLDSDMNFQTIFSKSSSRSSTWKSRFVIHFVILRGRVNSRWNRFRNLIRLKKVWTSADNFTYVAATGETILSSSPYSEQKWIALSFASAAQSFLLYYPGKDELRLPSRRVKHKFNRTYYSFKDKEERKKNYACHAYMNK